MEVIFDKPSFTKMWLNNIHINNININRLKDRNNRKEIKIHGKKNKIEYEILVWFRNDYFTSNNTKIKKMTSKKGLGCSLNYLDDETFNVNISIKSYIPKIIDIKGKDGYHVIKGNRSNKLLGAKAKLKITNKDLLKIHPGMQFTRDDYPDRIHYSHNVFYSGGGCSPR